MVDQQRRLPSKDVMIADISSDDVRIRIVGMIIDKIGDSLIVDDGSGKITVMLDAPTKAEIKDQVRVWGRVMAIDNGFELHGEIVQPVKGLDLDLYRKLAV